MPSTGNQNITWWFLLLYCKHMLKCKVLFEWQFFIRVGILNQFDMHLGFTPKSSDCSVCSFMKMLFSLGTAHTIIYHVKYYITSIHVESELPSR